MSPKKHVLHLIWAALCFLASLNTARAADADLQQYNGTPTWSSDLTTASTLLPRDGKRVTADNNAVGSAPVNRSLRQIKDLLIGLHDGVVGSRTGALQVRLRSVHVDYSNAGATASPGLFGVYIATSGGHGGLRADGDSWLGSLQIGQYPTIRSFLRESRMGFSDTVASGANPTPSTARANTLDALTIPKAWVTFSTDGQGSIALLDGARVTGIAIVGGKIEVTFATPFDNAYYSVVGPSCYKTGGFASLAIDPADKAVGTCKVQCGGFDPATTAVSGSLIFFGRQTT